MRKLCLLFFLYWNVCLSLTSCEMAKKAQPPSPPPVVKYDKTVRIDTFDQTSRQPIPWSEHASATVAPLIVPLTTAIKMILP